MINCDNIRKLAIKLYNPDGTITSTTIYFDVVENVQITAKQAQQCPNIQSIDFTCATVCTPT